MELVEHHAVVPSLGGDSLLVVDGRLPCVSGEVWRLSAVLRGERPDGPVYFKAVFPLFHHEPAVTEALAAEHPSALPELVAVDHERGWMLMRELARTHDWSAPDVGWTRALHVFGEIQR